MKRQLPAYVALVVVFAGFTPVMAQEREQPNTGDLTKASKVVQQAVRTLVGAHKISEFGTETTLGKTLSVVEFDIRGKEYAFGIDSAGNVAVRWVGIDLSVVPPAVIRAANTAHPGGTVSEATIATVGDQMSYALNVKAGGQLHEMQISPGGSVIADRVKGKED